MATDAQQDQELMTDGIDYKVRGDDIQLVEIELDPGEGVRAEVGTMIHMDHAIEMETGTGGGIFEGFKRAFSGESFFITTFAHGGTGKANVSFAAPYPGKIIPVNLGKEPGSFICQKDAFLCANATTDLDVAFTKKIGAGLFGGEGFILQELSGEDWAFIHAGGTVVERQLGPDEQIQVDTGCIAGFSSSVGYDIEFIGGFKNALFGGEGLFLATLRGPGTAYIQSLPFSRLADRVATAANLGAGTSQSE